MYKRQGPDRPGLQAVRENGVWSPLLEHGVDKAGVRALARRLGLSVAERPANACLSSRIPRGQPVTAAALLRVARAKDLLSAWGFAGVRGRPPAWGPPPDGGAARRVTPRGGRGGRGLSPA